MTASDAPGQLMTGLRRQPEGAPGLSGPPIVLAHTDWLFHHLTVTGPEADLAAFRQAAVGAGVVPWTLDLDRMEEGCF